MSGLYFSCRLCSSKLVPGIVNATDCLNVDKSGLEYDRAAQVRAALAEGTIIAQKIRTKRREPSRS